MPARPADVSIEDRDLPAPDRARSIDEPARPIGNVDLPMQDAELSIENRDVPHARSGSLD
jgi:hypothetical protein